MRVSPSLIGLAFAAALTSAPAMADAPLKAEVIHWWTSGGEAAAVKVFADAYDKAGGQWVDSAIAGGGGEAARTAGINRIVGGNPPTMMQFNTGKQLDELVSNSYLTNLDDAAAAGHWKDILPKPIVDASMRDGHWYALPVNIHGANWLFYNTKVFADAGVPEPKTWSDVLAAGPKLKAKGVIPFAHGGQPGRIICFLMLFSPAKAAPTFISRSMARTPRKRSRARALSMSPKCSSSWAA